MARLKDDNPHLWKIPEAELGVLKRVQRTMPAQAPEVRVTRRVFKPNMQRLMMCCVAPWLPGLVAVWMGYYYKQLLPPGDMSIRVLLVTLCWLFSFAMFASSFFLYFSIARRVITVEPQRIIWQDGDAMLTSGWDEVYPETPRFGIIKVQIVYIAGRRKSFDGLFFPDFMEIAAAINERVRSVQKYLNSSMHIV